jgi:hypothetical protein
MSFSLVFAVFIIVFMYLNGKDLEKFARKDEINCEFHHSLDFKSVTHMCQEI